MGLFDRTASETRTGRYVLVGGVALAVVTIALVGGFLATWTVCGCSHPAQPSVAFEAHTDENGTARLLFVGNDSMYAGNVLVETPTQSRYWHVISPSHDERDLVEPGDSIVLRDVAPNATVTVRFAPSLNETALEEVPDPAVWNVTVPPAG